MKQTLSAGIVANLPVALSVAAYGGVLGVFAAQKGIFWNELLLMNLLIFAGSAQFVMVEMWGPSLPVVEITLAVAAINLRYFLIGASLKPLFIGKSLFHKLSVMHLVADENWAVTMNAQRNGGTSTRFLLGGGVCILTAWCIGTVSGHQLQMFIEHPEAFALDFAFIAIFTALTIALWRGKNDLIPWISAALIAIVVEKLLPGKWYIVCGGVGGALIAMMTEKGGTSA